MPAPAGADRPRVSAATPSATRYLISLMVVSLFRCTSAIAIVRPYPAQGPVVVGDVFAIRLDGVGQPVRPCAPREQACLLHHLFGGVQAPQHPLEVHEVDAHHHPLKSGWD